MHERVEGGGYVTTWSYLGHACLHTTYTLTKPWPHHYQTLDTPWLHTDRTASNNILPAPWPYSNNYRLGYYSFSSQIHPHCYWQARANCDFINKLEPTTPLLASQKHSYVRFWAWTSRGFISRTVKVSTFIGKMGRASHSSIAKPEPSTLILRS